MTSAKIRTYGGFKKVAAVDEPVDVADILPPVIADRVRMMLTASVPFHHRENARNTLLLIRDELDKALIKATKDFARSVRR